MALPPNDLNSNLWNISVRGGTSLIISEISHDYHFLENEFQHQPGFSFDVALSRTIGNHWEPGINIGFYTLSGIVDRPYFSAIGNYGAFSNLSPGIPVEYENKSSSLLFFTRYYFRAFSAPEKNRLRFNPFAELGAGINVFATKVAYETLPPGKDDNIIFQKAGDNNGNVALLSLALGTKINFGSHISLVVSLNSDWVNYDCVDGVHNYTDGERNHAKTIISRLMAGIVIPISKDIYTGKSPESLPWSP